MATQSQLFPVAWIPVVVFGMGYGGAVSAADPRPTLQGLQDQINSLQTQVNTLKAEVGNAATGAYVTDEASHNMDEHDFTSPACDSGDEPIGVSYRLTSLTLGAPCATVVETGPTTYGSWGLQLYEDKEVEYNSYVCSNPRNVYIKTVCLDFPPAH